MFRSSQLKDVLLDLRGRAIAQAISRPLPTAMPRVRAQVRSCGICDGQSGTEAGFLRVLRFPLSIFIPPTVPQSSSIIRGWYNRPVSGQRTKWTQSHPTPRNWKKNLMDFRFFRWWLWRLLASGVWRLVVWWIYIDDSEERAASNFREVTSKNEAVSIGRAKIRFSEQGVGLSLWSSKYQNEARTTVIR
jgi:hypothetical protein